MMSKRRLESGAGCFTDVSCELTDEQYDTLTANAFPEGSQIPFESASLEGRSSFDYGIGIRTDIVRNKLWFIEEEGEKHERYSVYQDTGKV